MEKSHIIKATGADDQGEPDFYSQLYDEAWRSEDSDGTTLSEVPADYFDNNHTDVAGGQNNDLVSNVITEVSLDFLSGSRAAITLRRLDDSDDSQTSSDSGIKTIPISKGSYAKYPESTAGLSDNDWNPYGTESDSNITPRIASNNDGIVKPMSLRGSFPLSFSPQMSSTTVVKSVPALDLLWDMSDISETAESNTQYTLKSYASLDSSVTSEATDPLVKDKQGSAYGLEDLNKTFRKEELDAKTDSFKQQSSRLYVRGEDNQSQYLEKGVNSKVSKNHATMAVDYDLLQRDLQEIQDSLQRTLGPESKQRPQHLPTDADSTRSSDCEIIPSTTATPEKSQPLWDIVPSSVLFKKKTVSGFCPRQKPYGYSSDGDEAHTSGSSDKMEDHSENNGIDFYHSNQNVANGRDTSLISTDLSKQTTSCRPPLKSPDSLVLAEKVLRILSQEDLDHHVTGILSDATSKDLKSKYSFSLQNSYSFSNDVDDAGMFELGAIRKKLELSDMSSSKVSVGEPTSKMSGADDMTQFASKQMLEACEKSFLESRDIRLPRQVIQCYPVMGDHNPNLNLEDAGSKSQTNSACQPDRGDSTHGVSAHTADVKSNENSMPLPSAGEGSGGTEAHPVLLSQQKNNNQSQDNSPVSSDSDCNSSRWKEKYRPYKPPGSKQVYYTESDAVSVADSVTTVESSHFGSDDAKGPLLPASVLGSRADPPMSAGIYSTRKSNDTTQPTQTLASIPEKANSDEQESEGKRGASSQSDAASFTRSVSNQSDRQTQQKAASGAEEKNSVSGAVGSRKLDTEQLQAPEEFVIRQGQPQIIRGGQGPTFDKTDTSQARPGESLGRRLLLERPEVLDEKRRKNRSRHFDFELNSGQSRHVSNRSRFSQDGSQADSTSKVNSSSIRDPCISEAFHRALSPELLQSIGRRSPLLGSTIEGSLAQPPALSRPSHDTFSTQNSRPTTRSTPVPPTFLARDKSRERSRRDEELAESRRYISKEDKEKPFIQGQGRRYAWDDRDLSVEAPNDHLEHGHGPVSSDNWARDAKSSSPLGTSYEPQPRKHAEIGEFQSRLKESGKAFVGRGVELTLDGMSTDSQDTELDHEPVSQRAKLLTHALAQDTEFHMPQDIDRLWEKFLAANQSVDSTLDSARVEDVADLLRNPARHLISKYMREREEYRIQRLERSEMEMEKKRKELEKLGHGRSKSKSVSKTSVKKASLANQKDGNIQNGDGVSERLFSIIEDASFEQSPGKTESSLKQKVPRQQHLIDPDMMKLRDRITNQRRNAEKEAQRKQQKLEKLKKLEHLLIAKKQGKISNQTFDRHLEDISLSSSDKSDSSLSYIADSKIPSANPKWKDSGDTTPLSNESTTVKDSSTDMLSWKAEKMKRLQSDKPKKSKAQPKEMGKDKGQHAHYDQRKLFQLVSDGYLTPDEAYELCFQRNLGNVDLGSESSKRFIDDKSYNSSKPHQLYSPYTRNHKQMYQQHPVPRLKLSPRVDLKLQSKKHQPSSRTAEVAAAIHSRNYIQPKSSKPFPREKSFESPDEESSRTILSDDVSSAHDDRQSCETSDSLQEFSFQPNSHKYPPAKQSFRQDLRGSHRINKQDARRKKQGQSASENEPPQFLLKKGIAWQIPVSKEAQQETKSKHPVYHSKVQPLKERPGFNNPQALKPNPELLVGKPRSEISIWETKDHPEGIPRKLWEKVVQHDPLASKINHWEVDPLKDKVQYILDRQIGEDMQASSDKTGQVLSLQDCFLSKKQSFISKCRERQKRIALARENRHFQECLRLEREALFGEQDRGAPSNLFAHPYSDNLFQPKRRVLTKQEMKELTSRRYKKLPEVLEKQANCKRSEEMKTNRLRLKLFNRKVQRDSRAKYSQRLHQ
uniref:ALMS motif domain-containing protein n=1 Tax=Biomphalaria glabrata TaxID=6526 RepID=A0A2C9KJR5_BIOGL